jgi:hypothetical protein
MEVHKNTNKQLSDLLNEARHEKPVMNLKEVESIISQGKYTPAAGNRGFHIGMNNLIVVCGIVVSSFLAYMALKVDSGDMVSSTSVPANTGVVSSNQGTSQTALQIQPAPVTAPAVETAKNTSAAANRTQPQQNPATLSASADNMVVTESESDESMAAPVANKMPSGEYQITFNYAGQDIRMNLEGEEISEFYIDGNPVSESQYGDYEDILAEGKNYLIGNTHAEAGSSSLNLIKYFDSELREDKILADEVRYTFELTSSELIIQGKVQTEDMFKKYKSLYETKTGKTVTSGSVYKFERGAKSE